MSKVNQVTNADGNVYLVNETQDTSSTSGTVFNQIFNGFQIDNSLDDIFNAAAEKYNLNVNFLKAVAQAESGFDAEAVSYCGAQGIMQLMPSTSEWLGVENPFDPVQNIDGGARLLASLMDSYEGNATLALAAYNAGSGNVEKYGGVPPFEETQRYIEKINEILGGALEKDSKTLEVTGSTDFSRGSNISVPNISVSSEQEPLISYDEYLYVINTYKEYLSEIFSRISQDFNDNSSLKLYNIVKGSSEQENIISEGVSKVVHEDKTIVYDQQALNINMLNDNSVERILKNDAQSLYQAQTSMISPLVVKLLDL